MASSKYKGVTFIKSHTKNSKRWMAQGWSKSGHKWSLKCDTEREAALHYDKKQLEMGLEPVNILKRVK